MNANLRTWLDWCKANATDPSLDDPERDLWADLADRIAHYLEEQA